MSSSQPASQLQGYLQLLRAGLIGLSSEVEAMHHAIAERPFRALRRVPGVSGPAAVAEAGHALISGGVYRLVRHGGGGLLAVAALLEQRLAKQQAAAPNPRSSQFGSALNAVVGDHLAATDNPLAVTMGLYHERSIVPLTAAALAQLPGLCSARRVVLFLHGLGCDEHSWRFYREQHDNQDYGQRLQADFGDLPLYLRYNTGLPIEHNGYLLNTLLNELYANWPTATPPALIIIGHSMGGLVARRGSELAADQDAAWLQQLQQLVCLGSPHLGAPLAKIGHLVHLALQLSPITAPLARIASARSAGVQDLRDGLTAADSDGAHRLLPGVRYRFLASSLSADPQHPIGQLLGDGLVTVGSASGPDDEQVSRQCVGGLHHLQLLNHPAVYPQLRAWLQPADDAAD